MMDRWDDTEATRLTGILARERRHNAAIQLGSQRPKRVERDCFVFTRCYRDSRCLVLLNKGDARRLELEDLELPDGEHRCLLTDATLVVGEGRAAFDLGPEDARVFAVRGGPVEGTTVIRLQVNAAPTQPGDRLAVIGDCPELGRWDLRHGYELECINSNTWFGDIPFNESAGTAIGYKFVILRGGEEAPWRENRVVRRRLVAPDGFAKWRDRWEE
jgi:cyclomaltodextrin glucanotransferase